MITQSRLKQFYTLNDQNKLVGIVKGSKNYGRVAGEKNAGSQARVMVDGVSYTTSRLVHLYRTGSMPEKKYSKDHQNKVSRLNREHQANIEMMKITCRAWL